MIWEMTLVWPLGLLVTLILLGIGGGVLLFLELGRRLGRRRAGDADGARAGAGVLDGAVFALLGLMIAFTFSTAASRFEARRGLIPEEANAISTAWLRLDVLPPDARAAMRADFRAYLDQRLRTFREVRNPAAVQSALAESARLEDRIWSRAIAVTSMPEWQGLRILLLPALNQMFDIANTRNRATLAHQPTAIMVTLVILIFAGALLAGDGMATGGGRPWTHMLVYTGVVLVALFVILDLEYPRVGFIREQVADQVLLDLRIRMGEAEP